MTNTLKLGLSIAIGLLLGSICSSFLFAQEMVKQPTLTKADYYYNATRTPEIYTKLTENELLLTKEQYNNTQEITQRLDKIIYQLQLLNRKIK